MSEEIKPCPFCGSEIEEKDFVEEWIGWWVTCPVCDSLPVPTTKEEAMQQWNQRPYDYDMPAIVKKVQELQYDLSEALTILQTTLTLNPNAINDINKKVLEKHKRFDVFTEAGF